MGGKKVKLTIIDIPSNMGTGVECVQKRKLNAGKKSFNTRSEELAALEERTMMVAYLCHIHVLGQTVVRENRNNRNKIPPRWSVNLCRLFKLVATTQFAFFNHLRETKSPQHPLASKFAQVYFTLTARRMRFAKVKSGGKRFFVYQNSQKTNQGEKSSFQIHCFFNFCYLYELNLYL